MRILVILSAFSTLAAAFKTHFLPSAISTAQLLILNNNNPIASEYRDQDTKGFYSYGYKGELSAKAEYRTTDGTSKGFYSYVDADGKLQTVKYEASRMQGFQATASNLPTAPMDTNRAPEPVKDTPEVQLARKAHFDAYREAALKAALSPDTGSAEEMKESFDYNESDQQHQEIQMQQQQQQQQQPHQTQLQLQQQEQQQINSQLQQNTRDLLLSHQNENEFMNQQHSAGNVGHDGHDGHASNENLYKMHLQQQQHKDMQQKQADQQQHRQQRQQNRHQMKKPQSQVQLKQQQQQQQQEPSSQNHRLTTVYKLNGDLSIDHSPLSELHTVYRLNNIDSNAELKLPITSLSELTETEPLNILQAESHPTLLTTSSYEPTATLQYQYHIGTSDNPQYTLSSPTVLTSLPSIESVHLNNPLTQLQLGTASFLSSTHRLNGKSII